MKRSTLLVAGFVAVLVTACSSILGGDPDESGTSPGSEPSSADCIRPAGDNTPLDSGALASDALFLAGETFICANDVVVVGEGNLNQIAVASQLAAALQGPLFFPEPRLSAELGRLKAARVHVIGEIVVDAPGGAETITHDIESAVDAAKAALGVEAEVSLGSVPDSATIVETVLAIDAGDRVVRPTSPPPGSTPPESTINGGEVVVGLAQPPTDSSIWIVDVASPETVLLGSALASSSNASVLAVDGTDLLGYPEVADALRGQSPSAIRPLGAQGSSSEWERAVLTNGQQVPGGGFYVLPEEGLRRYVAYYGFPGTDDLGILGEQGPAETRSLMQGFVDAYSADGAQVIPTFEIIASVASAGAGDDGNYSYEWPADTFSEWIDYARDNDMYVILDLQSGRADFLTQAKLYEELLLLPFVGLALDPEWRLLPDQVHLEQVGSVQASEINETVNYVADLVRDNGLPQKMMIVHQFRMSMIQNRADIIERPEIQMVIQMDGDGTEPQKDFTWTTLLEGTDDAHWAWGWKNFFDEDEPGPPPPESTMSKQPTPIFVSYQ